MYKRKGQWPELLLGIHYEGVAGYDSIRVRMHHRNEPEIKPDKPALGSKATANNLPVNVPVPTVLLYLLGMVRYGIKSFITLSNLLKVLKKLTTGTLLDAETTQTSVLFHTIILRGKYLKYSTVPKRQKSAKFLVSRSHYLQRRRDSKTKIRYGRYGTVSLWLVSALPAGTVPVYGCYASLRIL